VGAKRLERELCEHATGPLHMPRAGARRQGVIEAKELVSILFLMAWAGTLVWTPPEDAPDHDVIRYACSKLRGILSTLRRWAARTVCDDTLAEHADLSPDVLAMLIVCRAFEDLDQALEDDADASAYLPLMREGHERRKIVALLGWTAEHAKVVHERIMRRAAALYRANDNENEDVQAEPPSSRAA
jgi:hypothetical protein